MAITKILNIKESEGRNPASHLKNALEYIQNPDKTEECVLVGGINCLPDTAFEQMEETKNIFHKTGKRQGYHVIISFSPEEKVTAEQAMYVLEHFAKDVLGDDYEVVYAVHTDREHMLIAHRKAPFIVGVAAGTVKHPQATFDYSFLVVKVDYICHGFHRSNRE